MRLSRKKTKSMVVSRSLSIAPGYGDLTLDGAELEEVKSLCIFGATLDDKFTFETFLREVVSKAARSLAVVAEQESYLVVHVCSRTVSKYICCSALSIQPSCECRRRSLIWVCWIVLFPVRKGCARVIFVDRAYKKD